MINKIVTIRDRLLLLKSIIDTLGYCYQELKLLKKKHAFTLSENQLVLNQEKLI